MKIGIPKEIKPKEGRVALIPPAAAELAQAGHEVLLQSGAGLASGYPDLDYRSVGVQIIPDAASLYAESEMIVKVKEPVAAEYGLLRERHLLFSYLHLAADPGLARVLQDKGLTAVAFETIAAGTQLPLLAPMSDIAGRLAVQIGTTLLHSPQGGRGLLLGGLAGAERGHVVVLGAGAAGSNAVVLAAALGAQVTVFDRVWDKLLAMQALGPNVTALMAHQTDMDRAVEQADLLIGAVLVAGARAPRIVTEDMVRRMKPGSVIVDVSIDQGGCVETIRPTDYTAPTFVKHGVIHFGVTNMPGAVPRTASQVLSAVLVPYVLRLAAPRGLEDPAIRSGINVKGGRIVHPAVAESLRASA